jgi:predicted nucleic acid-binding protein
MVGGVVLDNSVLIPLVVADEDPAYSERVLQSAEKGTRILAPSLCLLEFGNTVLTCVRRERMTMAEVWTAHERVAELPIEFAGALSFHEMPAIHALAISTGLSFYDASYLMLAMVKCTRIATLDKALRAAAKTQGVEIFE